MELLGPIESLLSVGVLIMGRHEYYNRNAKLFQTYMQIIKQWENELSAIADDEEVKSIVKQCQTMMHSLQDKFIRFGQKWKITRFIKAKKIHEDINAFANAMQNLMDILSFRISIKNREKLDTVNDKLDVLIQSLDDLKNEHKADRNEFSLKNKGLVNEVSFKLKDNLVHIGIGI
jgi:hypothetical protein